MGLFSTHWLGEYEGHKIEVVRRTSWNKFELLIDDRRADLAKSLVNVGEHRLEGTIHHGGVDIPVHAVGTQGAFTEGCTVVVGDRTIAMKKIG